MNRAKNLFFLMLLSACATTYDPENFQDTFRKGPCVFGRAQAEKDSELPHSGYVPAVYCKNESHPFYALDKEWIDYDWAAVYHDGNDRYVAILDYAIEGGFETVPVIESFNKGASWKRISLIEKPHFSARITKLIFDGRGNGEIDMEWEMRGMTMIKYLSHDNGKTWKLDKQPR